MRDLPPEIRNSVLLADIGSNRKRNRDGSNGLSIARTYRGIKNTSVHCYMISAIQLLYMNPRFRTAVKTLGETSGNSAGTSTSTVSPSSTPSTATPCTATPSSTALSTVSPSTTTPSTTTLAGKTKYTFSTSEPESLSFLSQLHNVFLALDRVTRFGSPVPLSSFVGVIQQLKVFDYIPKVQMDATEFLVHVFTVINDYCRYINKPSPVMTEFQLTSLDEFICSAGHYRAVKDSGDILKTELDTGDLQTSLHELSSWKLVRDYTCEDCKLLGLHTKQTAITRRLITHTGNNILIQLERFRIDDSGSTVKRNNKFSFPISDYLHLTPGNAIDCSTTNTLDLYKQVCTPTETVCSPLISGPQGSYADPVELTSSDTTSSPERKKTRHGRHRKQYDLSEYEVDLSSDWEEEWETQIQRTRKRLRVQNQSKPATETAPLLLRKSEVESSNTQYYQLVGVLCHNGQSQRGHYTSFALEEQFPYRWVEFNDDFVKQAGLKTIPSQTYGSDSDSNIRSAYLLIYKHCIPGKTSIPTYQSVVETPVSISCIILITFFHSYIFLLFRLVEPFGTNYHRLRQPYPDHRQQSRRIHRKNRQFRKLHPKSNRNLNVL